MTRRLPFMRLLSTLVLLVAASGWGAYAASAAGSARPGALDVSVGLLPAGAHPSILVLAPDGARYHVPVSGRLRGLPTGDYTIEALPISMDGDTYEPNATAAVVRVGAGSSARATISYATVIPATTKVLGAVALGALRAVSADQRVLTFDLTSAPAANLAVGDVLVAGVSAATPEGLLRRVISLGRHGATLAVVTAPATLSEAIKRGRVDRRFALSQADITGGLVGHGKSARDTLFNLSFNQTIPCGSAGETVKVNGRINFTPSITFSASWGWFTGVSASVSGSLAEQSAITVIGSAGVSCQAQFPLTPLYTFAPIEFFVGPVPVVLTPRMQVLATLSGQATAVATMSATQQATITAGLSYANGQFTPSGSFTSAVAAGQPRVRKLTATMQAVAGPEMSLLLYGVIGPEVNLDGAARLSVAPLGQPWWTLQAGVMAGAGLDISFLGLNINENDPTIIVYMPVVAHA